MLLIHKRMAGGQHRLQLSPGPGASLQQPAGPTAGQPALGEARLCVQPGHGRRGGGGGGQQAPAPAPGRAARTRWPLCSAQPTPYEQTLHKVTLGGAPVPNHTLFCLPRGQPQREPVYGTHVRTALLCRRPAPAAALLRPGGRPPSIAGARPAPRG
jgi:hypothetical protein